MLFLALLLVQFLVTSENFEWDVVGQYLFFPRILQGLWTTIWLTVVCMVIAVVLGTLVAVARMSPNPILSVPSAIYVWFFRGTPVLVQLIFWFNLSSLIPEITIALPFGGPVLFSESTNALITPLMAAILGLGLNEAAYMSEIVRGGILGVDQGQSEAATALGMPKRRILQRIVLPQAMRLIIPPSSNEFINLLKTTSLVSVITLSELLYSAQSIYSQSFQIIPLLVVASIWYLVVVSVLSFGQRFLEQRFSRGSSRSAPVSLWARFSRNLMLRRPRGAAS
ncbi:amino acid ABC transporter permease [Microbacterium sp. 18062]|uniref:amino acid ABC transporter permease n=1 Tax=Microbacterium sp. 18062 TaxID=2681410 RepID=UPI001F3A45E6|nr:amino acid ABC transporter permease [Microbacterium sp. 18062]